MAALTNARWETVARCTVQGLAGSRAYIAAGYKARGHAAEANASRLLRKAEVQARISELEAEVTAQVLETTALTKEWVVQRLMSLADGHMLEDNRPVPVQVSRAALHDLAQHLGMFATPPGPTREEQARAVVRLTGCTLDEAREAIVEAEAALRDLGD